jgi:serine/threonine protein kinase
MNTSIVYSSCLSARLTQYYCLSSLSLHNFYSLLAANLVPYNSTSPPPLSYFHDTKNVYLLLEYLSGGELFKRMSKSGGFLSETVCKAYMKDIAMGLSYLHDRQVMHRDIKPENILIGEDGRLRLTDLGWAVNAPQNGSKIGPNNPGVRYTMCGTPEYLAPEMVAGTGHTLSVDLWALGVLLYEMLYGR